MRRTGTTTLLLALALSAAVTVPGFAANAFRERGKASTIADSLLTITPTRDWNRLGISPGKKTEVWTLDGEELNDVTFFAGIEPGKPLIREVSKKRKPLPKFTRDTLLVDIPELLEGTYRASRNIATFTVSGARPDRFLDRDGIRFTFDYVDEDNLPRRGEGRASLVDGLLYMATFSAPRLYYHDRTLADFHALTDAARLN
ncbi:hypothetical protein Q5H91_14650 [Sphingomonas sp. KR1UV-12]|uniref:Uncharacterized protein n=1 Tax=Sphingomonas aurea TaxID=3063994 RepID=A0ABT9END7_9SPHN|nr:hypothetical protein [Sphingomonas sp. KR1UV-12]MDP1028459.1 hypothetical protein [Sphingomonas sp. KR1UV-12]